MPVQGILGVTAPNPLKIQRPEQLEGHQHGYFEEAE